MNEANTSDGCTLFPEGKQTSCCTAHDYGYMYGVDRRKIDTQLLICVASCNRPWYAIIMFIAVRTFGWIWWIRAKHIVKKCRENSQKLANTDIPK